MGILEEPERFIRDLKLPIGFTVCELGDQKITHTTPHYDADLFYRNLGCSCYESIDGNGRGTITHDLNLPLVLGLDRGVYRFDLVTDFGTGEHIFNQAQVFETIHQLVKDGGYFAWDRPQEGYPGHCYFKIDPCLFEDFAAVNGYKILRTEVRRTSRGDLHRGVMQKGKHLPFKMPQQGRYHSILKPIMGGK